MKPAKHVDHATTAYDRPTLFGHHYWAGIPPVCEGKVDSNGVGVGDAMECVVSGAQWDSCTCAIPGCTETTPIDTVGRKSILDLASPR